MKNVNKNTLITVSIVLIIVAAMGGFLGGMQYQKSQLRNSAFGQVANRNFGNGNGTFQRNMNGQQGQKFTPVRGEILSIGNGTMTIKEQNGTTKIVVIGSSTVFVKSQTGTKEDVKQGDTVMVIGNTNSDGSVTATDVQINPQGFLKPSVAPQTK